jgi:dolichol-phosphate mannosyltransferase
MSRAWLLLPTYNEAQNIEPLVRAVLPQLESAGVPHTVLIIDDASPDGTGDIADRLAAELEPVRVVHRPAKEGLGRAYLDGFALALAEGAELVLQMDSDFSHDPADIPRLVAAAEHADLVLGSRYVPGGGVADWGLVRRTLSRGGSWYARRVLGVDVRDLTGGFKCYRAEVLEAIDLPTVRSHGYAFQVELTFRTLLAGFTVVEVPIVFRDRRHGRSKMSMRIALEAMWLVPSLRKRAHAVRGRARRTQARAAARRSQEG